MLITLGTLTSIYLIVSYYRNLFSAPGYLTFTLPTSSWSLLNSRMIVGFAWSLLNVILSIGSAMLLIGAATGFQNYASVVGEFLTGTFVLDLGTDTTASSMTLLEMFGFSPLQLCLILILMLIGSCFSGVAMGYGSVTIGQLYAKHKVAGAVVTYIALNFLTQILTGVLMIAIVIRTLPTLISMENDLDAAASITFMQSFYHPLMLGTTIITLVIGVGCYVASGIIMKKKVNLD